MRRVRGRVALAAVAFVAVAAVLRVAVVPAERCPEATPADRRAAVDDAVAWLARNQQPDGSWVYSYDADRDEILGGYNIVRHAGVVLSLYQAAGDGVTRARPVADDGLGFARGHLVRRDGWAAFGWPGAQLEAGATALLTAAVLERRERTGKRDLDALAQRLGAFLVGQVRADGAVLARWDPDTGAPVPEQYDRFATGETWWALARLHRAFPAGGWDEPARRVGDYVATRRDHDERRFPYLSDHWSAYALDEMARWPGESLDDAEVAYARRLAGILGVQVRFESQRRAGGLARIFRGPMAPGSGLGTLGEGLAALDRLGTVDPRIESLRAPIAVRSDCVAGLLVERQVDAREAGALPRPGLARGAWFHEGVTRMDDQQHAISALLAIDSP